MTDEQFWHCEPSLYPIYRRKHRAEMEQQNEMMWTQGQYILRAVANVLGGKSNPYPTEPFRLFPPTKEEQEAEKKRMVDNFAAQLKMLGQRFKGDKAQ